MSTEDPIDELLRVVTAGVEMRTAQALYFRSRSSADLIASKNAEKAFDRLACAVIHLHRWRLQGEHPARPAGHQPPNWSDQ